VKCYISVITKSKRNKELDKGLRAGRQMVTGQSDGSLKYLRCVYVLLTYIEYNVTTEKYRNFSGQRKRSLAATYNPTSDLANFYYLPCYVRYNNTQSLNKTSPRGSF
jgi:hypothetical protein